MNDLVPSLTECYSRIMKILSNARAKSLKNINSEMVTAYWLIGREIVEAEQKGRAKADYGSKLIRQLSARLTAETGSGFSVTNLKLIRQFYLTYIERRPQIGHTVCDQFSKSRNAFLDNPLDASSKTSHKSTDISPWLSWSHYRILISVSNPQARSFYEVECAMCNWSVRELQRQIGSRLYERLAQSRDKDGLIALAKKGHEVRSPSDLLKDPFVLEFIGLPESNQWTESDMEQALIDSLQRFLLELGRDLFFVGRQKRITIDGDHFYIDLVFYHRILRCFLLIDLKLGKLSQRDIGQMLVYTGWYEEEEMCDGENPPIGLILCTDKNEAMVHYALNRTASQVFASRYQLHLPTEMELTKQLQRERRRIEDRIDSE